MNFWILVLVFMLSSLASCKTDSVYFDFGGIVDEKYENSYFQFRIDVPEAWSAQAAGESEWKVSQGYYNEETNQVDPDVKADIRDVQDALLVVMLENEPPPDLIPASITIFAESIYYNDKVANGMDYLKFSTEEIMEMGNFTIVNDEYKELTLDKKSFYMMDAKLDVNGQEVFQSFVSTTMKKFGLSAILTYSTEEQKVDMLDILRKIEFYGE